VLGSLLTSREIYDDCGKPEGRAPEIQDKVDCGMIMCLSVERNKTPKSKSDII